MLRFPMNTFPFQNLKLNRQDVKIQIRGCIGREVGQMFGGRECQVVGRPHGWKCSLSGPLQAENVARHLRTGGRVWDGIQQL